MISKVIPFLLFVGMSSQVSNNNNLAIVIHEPPLVETGLVAALVYVESGGDTKAFNPKENAAGILQIRPIMVEEVNRILSLEEKDFRFNLEDRWDVKKSVQMFYVWKNYHHSNSSEEVIARNWNGGPKGYIKESTLGYWERVKSRL